MLKLHTAVILFGLSGLFAKFLPIPASSIVLGRTAIAAFVLGVLLFLRGTDRAVLRSAALVLVPSGVLLALHWLTFFTAIQVSTVATGLLSYAAFPIFVAFLDPLFSGRRVQGTDLLFAAAVCFGLILVVPNYDLGDRFVQGTVWGLASAGTFALLTLVNRRFVSGRDPLVVGFYQNFWAAIILLPLARPLTVMTKVEWGNMLFLGVFCTALAHTLFISALKAVRPQAASIAAGLEPVYGILLAFILLGEAPFMRELAGGFVIIAVVLASSWRETSARADLGSDPNRGYFGVV